MAADTHVGPAGSDRTEIGAPRSPDTDGEVIDGAFGPDRTRSPDIRLGLARRDLVEIHIAGSTDGKLETLQLAVGPDPARAANADREVRLVETVEREVSSAVEPEFAKFAAGKGERDVIGTVAPAAAIQLDVSITDAQMRQNLG